MRPEILVDSLRSAVSGTTESVNQVLAQGSQCYDAISGQINNAFSSISTDAGVTAGALNSVASEVQVMIDRYTGFRDSVQQLADSFPLASDLLQPIIGNLNESIAHQEAVRDKLNEAAARLRRLQVMRETIRHSWISWCSRVLSRSRGSVQIMKTT